MQLLMLSNRLFVSACRGFGFVSGKATRRPITHVRVTKPASRIHNLRTGERPALLHYVPVRLDETPSQSFTGRVGHQVRDQKQPVQGTNVERDCVIERPSQQFLGR